MLACVLRLETNRYCDLERKLKIFGKEIILLCTNLKFILFGLKLKFSLKIK